MKVSSSEQDISNLSTNSMLKYIVDSMAKLEEEVSGMAETLESLFPNTSTREMT